MIDEAVKIAEQALKEPEKFFQNQSVQTPHRQKIESLCFSANGRYLCSNSKDMTVVWQIYGEHFKSVLKVPFPSVNKQAGKSLAAVDDDGRKLIYYKGCDFKLAYYDIMTEPRQRDRP